VIMAYKYSKQQYDDEHMARAVSVMMPVSFKQSVEVCSFIRTMDLQKAKRLLREVMQMKRAVPYTRFNKGVAHKKGMAAGKYPVQTCEHLVGLLESVEANAQFKGLSTANLVISHIVAQKAGNNMHYGRQRGTKMKKTHIEVIVEEKKKIESDKNVVKEQKKNDGSKVQEKEQQKKEQSTTEVTQNKAQESKKVENKEKGNDVK
jgi:large subunit ribosomal protein L22